jgi:hypothetical protein
MENILCKVPFIVRMLSENINICDEIRDAYFRQVPQPKKKEDVNPNYVGKLNRYNSPYRVHIYGAYPLMIDWEQLQYKLNDKTGFYKQYEEEKVWEAFKEYAKGFQYGFDNFKRDKIEKETLLSTNEIYKTQAVIDFISNPFLGGAFTEAYGEGLDIFSGWYDDGIQAGYRYAAWYFIFENHKLFEPYFKKGEGKIKILPFDFGASIVSDKVPFEIKFACQYSKVGYDLRYIGFGDVFIETEPYFRLIDRLQKGHHLNENLQVAKLDNLEPYYQSYENGFRKGYQQFPGIVKSLTELFLNDHQNTAKKVFQYITQPFSVFGKYGLHKNKFPVLKNEYAFEEGCKAGEKYRAWYYVVENPDYFIDLFRKHQPFIKLYRKAYEFWNNEQGGQGVAQRLQKLLQEIDMRDKVIGTVKNNTNKKYHLLKEIFINETAYNECMSALRNVRDPVISHDNKFLLGSKQKGAFTAWYEVVKHRQKFKPGIIKADVASLLNKEIDGLKLGEDGTTLRRPGTTMYIKYKVPFTKLIL